MNKGPVGGLIRYLVFKLMKNGPSAITRSRISKVREQRTRRGPNSLSGFQAHEKMVQAPLLALKFLKLVNKGPVGGLIRYLVFKLMKNGPSAITRSRISKVREQRTRRGPNSLSGFQAHEKMVQAPLLALKFLKLVNKGPVGGLIRSLVFKLMKKWSKRHYSLSNF